MGHVTCLGQLNVTVSLAFWVEAFSSLNSQQALFHVPSIEEKFLGLEVPLNGKELPWRAAQPHDRLCKQEIHILTHCNFVVVCYHSKTSHFLSNTYTKIEL